MPSGAAAPGDADADAGVGAPHQGPCGSETEQLSEPISPDHRRIGADERRIAGGSPATTGGSPADKRRMDPPITGR